MTATSRLSTGPAQEGRETEMIAEKASFAWCQSVSDVRVTTAFLATPGILGGDCAAGDSNLSESEKRELGLTPAEVES